MTSVNPISGVGSNLVKEHPIGTYYGLWMKHFSLANSYGRTVRPETVVEIGPGAMLTVGICALLTGARRYFAFDLVRHANTEANLEALDRLVKMYKGRAAVKNARGGFPDYGAFLDEKDFPSAAAPDDLLERTLAPDRLDAIRRAIITGASDDEHDIVVRYVVPWEDEAIIAEFEEQVDFLISHSTMEHVEDVRGAYQKFGRIMRSGGVMSHQIDFRSHGYSKLWNGYRAYSEEEWAMRTANEPYAINREPASAHVTHILEQGFDIFTLMSRDQGDPVGTGAAPRFSNLSPYDRSCSGLLVQAMKHHATP